MSDWIPYDHDDQAANPLPEITRRESELCWVFDEFYEGVTIAYLTQWQSGRVSWIGIGSNKDDIGVTFWQPIVKPEPPETISD